MVRFTYNKTVKRELAARQHMETYFSEPDENNVSIILLMLWEIACWTFGPTQNFNLVSLAPEVSSIALSLNSTFVQIGFALGAGIGGIVVGGWSIMAITWISAASAAVAILVFSFGRSLSRSYYEVNMEKQFKGEEYEIS